MSAGLSLAEAERLVDDRLGDTPWAAHSRFVGSLMGRFARKRGADADLWRVVGQVHDLDAIAIAGDWSRHGPMTAEWLAGRLPQDALDAIAAHDHRSGVTSGSELADMLKLADALAVLDWRAGREATCDALRSSNLVAIAAERTYLATMIEGLATRRGVGPDMMAALLEGLPRQG